ncbi:MAG: Rieske 2Fe-2S domain-containing protein [Burkholderiaceae bacterium]|mgnify:FL=1|nr:Rieske 2Fe-2S domain-containing protein [Anaerolineae bacterium]MEB2353330.1 Rieske 2Fe-2S domain-containing protein [Burkholderiaceae bacterium]
MDMTSGRPQSPRAPRGWPTEDCSRIPNWIYSDPAHYQAELDRIFYGPFWSFIGLECEIPNPGDWKLGVVGERSVIMTRDRDGQVHVLLNSCSHRGAMVCHKKFGHDKELMCPYHQWTFELNGNLIGVPFRRGLKGKGGFPADFDPKNHPLRKLKVESVNGAVFASFDDKVLPMKDYLGAEFHERMLRIFDGRELKVLGYQRQKIRANWKLYPENMKDSYHASLLHVFLISFGLYRIDQKGELRQDPRTLAHNLVSSRARSSEDEKVEEMKSLKSNFRLNDMRIVDTVKEYDDDVTIQILSMFPAFTLQQQQNLLQCRNVIPRGPDEFELSWTYFGYADDSEEMTQRRLRLANLTGAAGLISTDDTAVFTYSGEGMRQNADRDCVVELGGRSPEPPKEFGDMVSEGPIRGFYDFYRRVMFTD